MAVPSFSSFEWLHLQPAWYQPSGPKIDDHKVQAQAERVVARRVLKWHGFSPWEASRLVKVRDEWREGLR